MKGRQRRETVIIKGLERIVPPEVTFRDFASLAKRKVWTPEYPDWLYKHHKTLPNHRGIIVFLSEN